MRNALKCIYFSLIFLVMFCSLLGCAPSEPTEVAMIAGNEQITIQWKAVEWASSYNIYWSPVGALDRVSGRGLGFNEWDGLPLSFPVIQPGVEMVRLQDAAI